MKPLLMICLLVGLFLPASSALAANIKNSDAKTASLVVTEGSTRRDVSLKADQAVDICPKGCFVTFPNGDHYYVKAEDVIEINSGRASFK